MKSRKLFLVSVCTFLAVTAASSLYAARKPHEPIADEQGRQLYSVYLKESAPGPVDDSAEPPARSTLDPQSHLDFRSWHKPKVRALIKVLEGQYSIEATSMTSWVLPSFGVHMSEQVAADLARDPRVKEVVLLHADDVELSTWTNQVVGSETIPWGRQALGVSGTSAYNSIVYVLDGGIAPHVDLNVIWTAGVNAATDLPHGTHVAGIIGARENNQAVQGVQPNAQLIDVAIGTTLNQLEAALDWVVRNAEERGIMGTATLSAQ